jgi:pSer/pThr/pTyr-binding forkhead associated (FHA) protein
LKPIILVVSALAETLLRYSYPALLVGAVLAFAAYLLYQRLERRSASRPIPKIVAVEPVSGDQLAWTVTIENTGDRAAPDAVVTVVERSREQYRYHREQHRLSNSLRPGTTATVTVSCTHPDTEFLELRIDVSGSMDLRSRYRLTPIGDLQLVESERCVLA